MKNLTELFNFSVYFTWNGENPVPNPWNGLGGVAMPGGGPPSPPPIPDSRGIGNSGFWPQPSMIGGGVAACMGEFAVGRGDGAV